MSVASTVRKQQFSLDGATAGYTFTFRALTSAPTDIKCLSTTNGTDTLRTYTTEYSVAVNASGIGGTLTLVSPSTVGKGTLTIYRETTNTQESDYDDYNQFPADTVETDFDIRTLVSQEQDEAFDRTLSLPISVSGVSTELPVPEANAVVGWDGAGTALENKTFTPATSLEKASASDATTGTNDAKYMTPTMTTIMIATFTPTTGTTTMFGDIVYIIDGGGNAITAGSKTTIAIDFACSITKATIVADQIGSVVVDIQKTTAPTYPTTTISTTSICASAFPTLASKLAAQDVTLTGWTKNLSIGDLLRFDVTSTSTITSLALILKYVRSL